MHHQLLRFYLRRTERHGSLLLYEWLLQLARRHSASAASALPALAGFAHLGNPQTHTTDLGSDQAVVVDIAAREEVVTMLLADIEAAGVRLSCLRMPVEIVHIGTKS
ncbi:PII-like signaling protein [Andreprevotia lacus DSM 23236]|jgi:PII-like signaling protein|uniref:PII-like signaling protein n=1 Tax=Andreprevotia lacus DSM 23236 TaxID=1121001 RepID=A0A1W1XLC2_9NEIS|nr:DUF190 domain-containing protein [Andreprevotia lacus]SMC24736.1 PII-like signaling protein [Andreprevotia lacus DSM 23236]